MRLKEKQKAPSFDLEDIYGNRVGLKDFAGQKLMISFYRYSGCPLCNLRVADLIQAYPKLAKQDLKIISFWQSSKDDILESVGTQNVPFPLIPDGEKRIYNLYRVERHLAAPLKVLLNPSLLLRVIFSRFMKIKIAGEVDLVPADFLINPDLTLHTAYYGRHIGDHLPISDIESFLSK